MADDNANDVNTQLVETQETTTAAPSTAENNTPEVADSTSELWDDQKEEVPNPEAETDDKSIEEEQPPEETDQETETDEQPQAKRDANARIRQLVSEKKALKEELERVNAEVYKPQTIDELVEEGLSETDAKVTALEQRLQIRDYNDSVAEAQMQLEEESSSIMQDFPIFNPDNKEEFVPEIAAQAAELLEANLIRDPYTNQIIGTHISPYKLFKPIADAYEQSAIQGQIKGQKAAEHMVASAAPQSSASPRPSNKSPLMELWDK